MRDIDIIRRLMEDEKRLRLELESALRRLGMAQHDLEMAMDKIAELEGIVAHYKKARS